MSPFPPLRSCCAVLAFAAALAGCATPRTGTVIPREGGLYQVIATGQTEQRAMESALHSAESTCRGRGMRHIVLEHRAEYKGIGTESAAQAIEKVRRVLQGSTGQRAPEIAGEEDYRVSMQFRCEDGRH